VPLYGERGIYLKWTEGIIGVFPCWRVSVSGKYGELLSSHLLACSFVLSLTHKLPLLPSTAPRRVLTAGSARAAAWPLASPSLLLLRACRQGFGMRWDSSISLSQTSLSSLALLFQCYQQRETSKYSASQHTRTPIWRHSLTGHSLTIIRIYNSSGRVIAVLFESCTVGISTGLFIVVFIIHSRLMTSRRLLST
jgi:hypothetical protein